MTRLLNSRGTTMKKSVSSILFALSLFGGVAHAESDLAEVQATMTYDATLLTSADGAAKVLTTLERQAERACRKVSLVTVGLSVDKVCARDLVFQAVDQIANTNLTKQYASSDYFADSVSERLQVASR